MWKFQHNQTILYYIKFCSKNDSNNIFDTFWKNCEAKQVSLFSVIILGTKSCVIKSCPNWLKLSHIFMRYINQKMSKFDQIGQLFVK